MNYAVLYAIFALATALSATYEMFLPILREATRAGVVNEITQNPKLSISVFFLVHLIIAPVAIAIIMIPPLYAAAYTGMHKEFMRENSDLIE